MQKKGKLFVFSGPSGVGKGTLKDKLFEEFEGELRFSVSATTRPPRQGEKDGVDYFYITREEFDQRIAADEFLEHATFSGNSYGTPRSFVTGLLDQGVNVLLEIEVQGAMQVMEKMPECVSVFILPPSYEELERRLRGRATESEEKVLLRLETARRELPLAEKYAYRIVNNDLDKAYEELRAIYVKETKQA